jgi:hypothetical protein
MELRVSGPRVPMGESRSHDALDVFLNHPAGARTRTEDLLFGVGQYLLDGPSVTGIDLHLRLGNG